MSARIAGFGHLGIYVRDIALMTEFWRVFMGMQVTKQSDGHGGTLIADPPVVGQYSLYNPHA